MEFNNLWWINWSPWLILGHFWQSGSLCNGRWISNVQQCPPLHSAWIYYWLGQKKSEFLKNGVQTLISTSWDIQNSNFFIWTYFWTFWGAIFGLRRQKMTKKSKLFIFHYYSCWKFFWTQLFSIFFFWMATIYTGKFFIWKKKVSFEKKNPNFFFKNFPLVPPYGCLFFLWGTKGSCSRFELQQSCICALWLCGGLRGNSFLTRERSFKKSQLIFRWSLDTSILHILNIELKKPLFSTEIAISGNLSSLTRSLHVLKTYILWKNWQLSY